MVVSQWMGSQIVGGLLRNYKWLRATSRGGFLEVVSSLMVKNN